MLEEVQTAGGYTRISALGARLSDGIETLAAARGLNWRAFRRGPRSGFSLTPDLPRTASEAQPSMHRTFNAARRVFMANRGIWDAIWSAGPRGSASPMTRLASPAILMRRALFCVS
jgi:glutamate-1-semialdehyde 2,1-aminomutase